MLSQFVRSRTAASQLRVWKGRSLLQSSTILRQHTNSSRIRSLQASKSNISPETRPRRPSFQSSRSLATAADPTTAAEAYLDNPSYYAKLRDNQQWASFFPPAPGDFKPSSLIIVNEQAQTTKAKVFKKIKGVGGDEEEMMINLDLSLRHAQFVRASNLINKLREYHPIGSQAYLNMHNQLLHGMVSHSISTNDILLSQQVQRWFEVDMPWGGVQADATTYAIMIKMSLRMFYGGKRERSVRRYWQRAKDANAEEDVLGDPALTDRELGELSEICARDLQRVAIASMDPRADQSTRDVGPELRATEQKGLGLTSLRESISMFSDAPLPMKINAEDIESKEEYDQRRQEQLELGVMEAATNRWRKEYEEFSKMQSDKMLGGKMLGGTVATWQRDLAAKIREELKLVEEAETNPVRTKIQKARCEYGLYLRSMSAENLASLTILAAMGALVRNGLEKGIKLTPLVVQIGNDVYDETMAQRYVEEKSKSAGAVSRAKIMKQMLAGRQGTQRITWRKTLRKMEKDNADLVWPLSAKASVGAVLMNCLFEVAKVHVRADGASLKKGEKPEYTSKPAFEHSYQISWGRRMGYIHVHPELAKYMRREPASDLLGRQLPMLCKPKPWKDFTDGAYFLHKNRLIRSTPGESLQPAYVRAALDNGGLEKIREGLDILGGTAWAINHDVFHVMAEAWNSGKSVGDLAPLEPDMPHPPQPSREEGAAAFNQWQTKMRDIENTKSGYHSQRCFQNFQLEIARAYLNETFYFPHNLDFRGRAYPIPPYLNQMGADNARGLLLFSKPKPLGERGLKWLKIQLANLAGFDKASLSEREQFTMDHLDDVLDSANNGLHGRRWWLKAEDPWQCLAACCELRNALKLENPAEYGSRLPIHQDGSCNGLQHYAALGGDKIGAQQVNLEPSNRPSDVYSGVADYVTEAVTREAKEGNPVAKFLEGKITRKVVKQTVMTNVYGVTFIGAVKQVRKQLYAQLSEFSDEQIKQGSIYIARKIFAALGTMFNGAHNIQYWLGDCASRITTALSPEQLDAIAKEYLAEKDEEDQDSSSNYLDPTKNFRSTVIWTTPLGLPVVQPYRARVSRRVDTALQGISIVTEDSNFSVSKRKQLQAFPPNFIHSLDATHMMLSASACHQAGLTFAAVHDSFWTHASDVDSMNEILREAFVLMHSDDIVKRLSSEFKVRYGKHLFYAKVHAKSEAGKAVRSFRHANKRSSKLAEAIDEYNRQKLLNSDDPELQAQGRAMHTPGSIFEQFGGSEADFKMSTGFGETVVGHVPEDVEAAEKNYKGQDSDLEDPAMASLLVTKFEGTARAPAPDPTAEDVEEGDEAEDELEDPVSDQEAARQKPKKKVARTSDYVNVWLPMQFPDVPTKGEWDLTRIRESKYFFS